MAPSIPSGRAGAARLPGLRLRLVVKHAEVVVHVGSRLDEGGEHALHHERARHVGARLGPDDERLADALDKNGAPVVQLLDQLQQRSCPCRSGDEAGEGRSNEVMIK